jgi:hypothetical protein
MLVIPHNLFYHRVPDLVNAIAPKFFNVLVSAPKTLKGINQNDNADDWISVTHYIFLLNKKPAQQ